MSERSMLSPPALILAGVCLFAGVGLVGLLWSPWYGVETVSPLEVPAAEVSAWTLLSAIDVAIAALAGGAAVIAFTGAGLGDRRAFALSALLLGAATILIAYRLIDLPNGPGESFPDFSYRFSRAWGAWVALATATLACLASIAAYAVSRRPLDGVAPG